MATFKERELTKGNQRKLTALRKSLGKEIADRAFSEWVASLPEENPDSTDKNAEAIAKLLTAAVLDKTIKLPRGGYIVRRGRGRVVVERAQS
ncbi:MAG: hypothetical protein O7D91_21655 [Planctomycetota bacterium]|nr:hypothetical protein [Planctomycetota bacterium]